uniref:YceD family protein n=1 Tax=Marinobacterium profundum TaxID=1714300 RepID=UPI000832B9A9|nr:YceD family protein [Marinobacterium profundum]
MSYGPLPKKVDPRKLAEREVRIQGLASLNGMPRLSSYLVEEEGDIIVDLLFSLDPQRIRTVSGNAQGRVHMTCQRCLESVEIDVEASFNLAVAPSEEVAKTLPRHYDPLIVEDEDIELWSVVEEELILNLPVVPFHVDCSIQTSFGEIAPEDGKSKKPNPFSVLAKLKADADKS